MLRLLLLNDMFQTVSALFTLPVKRNLLTISTGVSIVGIVDGILSKNSVLTGCSVLLGVTNFVAWLDLGASEEVRGFKAAVNKELNREKKEGDTIEALKNSLESARMKLISLEGQLEESNQRNSELEQTLTSSQEEIKALKARGLECHLIIQKLRAEIICLTTKIEELTQLKQSEREQIQQSEQSVESVAELIRRFESIILYQDQRIKALTGNI